MDQNESSGAVPSEKVTKLDYFISILYVGFSRIYCQDFPFSPEGNEWNEKNEDEQQLQLKI